MLKLIPVIIFVLLAACSEKSTQSPDSQAMPSLDAQSSSQPGLSAAVDGERIEQANEEPGNWMSHGRTYDEQRFSPLDKINADNVSGLGLAWYFDFPTKRGIEATPIVVDGVMFVTGSWSIVYALDARTGEELWRYDPKVPGEWAVHLCCDVVNRGVAVWQGKVVVGTLDGRLIALDAASGNPLWEVQTTPREQSYSITGAPRIVKGKVIIGNGGAELNARGFVSAYDVDTGAMLWRFYTVPGDPSKPFENPVLERAAKTWTGQWWTMGGGGTAWDAMAYDPGLDLLYIGVGNGSPWNRQIRSPEGGDNLFLSSIVALRPDSGEYVWHYQSTPGETWDYTATQHMILADLVIDGEIRKVIMQAPKNGFFYVLDRATGEFISAEKYTKVTWASHIDSATGRPVENPGVRYTEGKPVEVYPSPPGGHNWHPMSYSPQTGLVYIPAQENVTAYMHDPDFKFGARFWNLGVSTSAVALPDDPEIREMIMGEFKGFISAWDPVNQKEAWRIPHRNMWNGGMLSTAGNLLFQGNGEGEFVAYRADSGERLWSSPSQTGIVAAPITYTVDGEQYVAVAAGWGGAIVSYGEIAARSKGSVNRSRVLVYRLGGEEQLPAAESIERPLPEPPPLNADADTLQRGHDLYMENCHFCHGLRAVSATSIPDLRYLTAEKHQLFDAIVLGGLYHQRGMAGFGQLLEKGQTDAIHAYLIKRSHDLLAELAPSAD